MPYSRIDAAEVSRTVEELVTRIERFIPASQGLPAVGRELRLLVDELGERRSTDKRNRRAIRWLSRILAGLVGALAVGALVSVVRDAVSATGRLKAFEWLPLLESGINDLVFAGVAIWFLVGLADRIVRNELLKRLHRLRSMAHIIDMHQMSKNVADLLPDAAQDLTTDGLTRRDYALYLDYCSEMLSLAAKAAALCAEASTDAVVLDTVSEIENLTSSMSRKIWQKVSLLHDAARD